MNLTDKEITEITKSMESCVTQLNEQGACSVILLVEAQSQGGFSQSLKAGAGSWFAQWGMMNRWMRRSEQLELVSELIAEEGE